MRDVKQVYRQFLGLGVVVHIYSASTYKAETGAYRSEASPGYIVRPCLPRGRKRKQRAKLGVVAYAYNTGLLEASMRGTKFRDSLGYTSETLSYNPQAQNKINK